MHSYTKTGQMVKILSKFNLKIIESLFLIYEIYQILYIKFIKFLTGPSQEKLLDLNKSKLMNKIRNTFRAINIIRILLVFIVTDRNNGNFTLYKYL